MASKLELRGLADRPLPAGPCPHPAEADMRAPNSKAGCDPERKPAVRRSIPDNVGNLFVP
jgi:hypothetical protein